MRMEALLFGSNGYLGRNLNHYFKSKNACIRCFDIHKFPLDNNSEYFQADISDPASFQKIDLNADAIFFFGGLTGTIESFEVHRRFVEVNELGLLNLLEEMKRQESKANIIFPSTRLVYEGKRNKLLSETDVLRPKTIYAINKVACENILWAYRNRFGINYTVFRICVPYGHLIEGDASYGTIGWFINNAKRKMNIKLFGDGKLRRTFTHVEDICEKIYLSAEKEFAIGEIFNIGGDNASLEEVACKIAVKYGIAVEYAPWPDDLLRIESGDTVFDGRKLEKVTTNRYIHSLDEWLS